VFRSHGSFPFVVLFPQCRDGGFWAFKSEEKHALEVLARSMQEDSIDPDRVYLTGNSLGGYGTWLIGAQHPETFAAIIPICGGVAPPKGRKLPPDAPFYGAPDPFVAVATALDKTGRKMPVWAFAGERDWLVDPDQTRKTIEALKRDGNDAKMTIYPGVGHDSWDPTYSNPDVWTWLAQQKR
jgi:predicted peptidase